MGDMCSSCGDIVTACAFAVMNMALLTTLVIDDSMTERIRAFKDTFQRVINEAQ